MSILKYESAFRDAVAKRERTICIDLLNRLTETGKVAWTGSARSTKDRLVSLRWA